jgi:hypothetical protein
LHSHFVVVMIAIVDFQQDLFGSLQYTKAMSSSGPLSIKARHLFINYDDVIPTRER